MPALEWRSAGRARLDGDSGEAERDSGMIPNGIPG
jgi:hypothetical protein